MTQHKPQICFTWHNMGKKHNPTQCMVPVRCFRLYWSCHKYGGGTGPLQRINFWSCHRDNTPFLLDSLILHYIQAKGGLGVVVGGGGWNNYYIDRMKTPYMLYQSQESACRGPVSELWHPQLGLCKENPLSDPADRPAQTVLCISLYFSCIRNNFLHLVWTNIQ